KQTILLGDLNAKNTLWGCTANKQHGTELLDFAYDGGFIFLNDKSPTHSSYSYAKSEALDVSIVSSDLSSKYRWNVLDNIGSDHLPLLIEYNSLLRSCDTRRNFLNFKKANWELYRSVIIESIEQTTFPDELEQNWLCFRGIILKSAMAAIPMGNIKNYQANYTHNLPIVKPLIIRRNILSRELLLNDNNSTTTELNRINAEVKRVYAYQRRKRWIEICQGIDVRTPDTKLWKLSKAKNNLKLRKLIVFLLPTPACLSMIGSQLMYLESMIVERAN
ncbi:hypothetical protein AVEN_255581-1, partial [Araneus ventricosus]